MREVSPIAECRRTGDAVTIDGGYQHRARTSGPVVQRFWHAEKERVITRYNAPLRGETVLDIGCGSGVIADFLARLGAKVIAIDSNPAAIEYARATFGRPEIDFRLATVEDIDAPAESIDRCYCLELVEHIHHPQAVELVARVRGLTKPGGTLLVTTPNYAGVWPALEWTLDTLRVVPRLRGEQHVTQFTAKRLRNLLAETGWSVERITTFSTIAPWTSLLGWNLAERVASVEDRLRLPFGSILLAVAKKDTR